jgi:hypothetical protein
VLTAWYESYLEDISVFLNRSARNKRFVVEPSWNVMAHANAREGNWSGNWRMEWVASILHTTSEHGVSSITTADAHTSAANSRLNWRPRRFKWTRPFCRKTKSGFCACAITFKTQSTCGNFPQHTLFCASHSSFELSYEYDYIIELCRKQRENQVI